MKHTTRIAAIALTAFAAITSVKAGSETKNPVATNAAASPTFTFLASENYDSRYVFRGVDVLAGTGILSTTFAPTWHITANDTLTVPLWYATAVAKNKNASQYRELDVPVNYLHTFDNGFNLGAGYTLYNYFNLPNGTLPSGKSSQRPGGTGIQNEINVTGGYSKKFGDITLISSLTYFYELGTANQYTYGSINPGSSFLTPSLGASIPLTFIKKDGSITFNPNTQYNISFVYNVTNANQYVSGGNDWQFQLPVTWQVTKTWSVTGYWAYEYQGLNLYNTANSFGWAGASVGASF
jgi:hypothetical protein